MKNRKKEKTNNIIGYITLVILYIVGFILYRPICKLIVNILTPTIQKKYYVDLKLYELNGEVASAGDDTNIIINPMANAIAFVLIFLLVYFLFVKIYKIYEKKGLCFDFNKLITILETFIIILGVFVAVYKWNSFDLTTYGIYKDELNQNSGLAYYKVEKMPVIVHFLHDNSESFISKFFRALVMNGEKIVSFIGRFLAVSGAVLLPLKGLMKKENNKIQEKEIRKLHDDLRSQLLDEINRKMKN